MVYSKVKPAVEEKDLPVKPAWAEIKRKRGLKTTSSN